MIDWQLPDMFPGNIDRLSSLSIPPSITRVARDTAPNAGGVSLATLEVEVRDEDKWEKVGRVVGGVAGVVVYSATVPVVLLDGPLPFVDAAWLWGGARFAYSTSKQGAKAGEFIDDTLIPMLE